MKRLLFLLLVGLTAAAWASVETLQVAAVGTYNQWLGEPWDVKVASVQLPNDEGTTRIYHTTLGNRESYTLPASAIPSGSTLNSVSVSMRMCAEYGVPEVRPFLRLGSTNQAGTSRVGTPTWATYLEAITRPGGGSWSLTDLATLEVGVEITDDDNWAWVTTLFVVVDYTEGQPAPSGDNSFFTFSIGGD